MGVYPATFNSGEEQSQHYLPGAYSRLNFVRGTGGLVSAANGVVMGDCRGGEPNVVHWFGSAAEAAEVLRAGNLLDAVKHAFSPGGSLVPQKVGAMRVNPGTQSSREFLSSAENMIDVLSWDHGLHTNQLKAKLSAATTTGKKIEVQFQNNTVYTVDNIYRNSFSIQYTGSGTACLLTITKTALTTAVDGTGDLDLAFASYSTIEELVNYINDQADYTCSLIGVSTAPSEQLDSVSAIAIKASAYTVQSSLQAIIEALEASPWIASATYDSAATSRTIPDNDSDYVYFTGGVDGAYTASEWTASLLVMESQDVQLITTPSTDAAVHALIKTHCNSMCSVTGKSERQFIVGGAVGETAAQVAARAAVISSEYGMLASPGFVHYDFNDTTKTKTWAASFYACKLMGTIIAVALNTPATSKPVDVLSWETVYTNTELENLIKAGVCCGMKRKTGELVTARSVTTYQGSELQRCEFSMMREALFISRDLRTEVEINFVGKAMNNSLLGRIDGVVMGKLSQYYDMGLFNGSPAYWGYTKSITGDQVKIDYNCNLTPPTNFIFITSHMHVYASLAAA